MSYQQAIENMAKPNHFWADKKEAQAFADQNQDDEMEGQVRPQGNRYYVVFKNKVDGMEVAI